MIPLPLPSPSFNYRGFKLNMLAKYSTAGLPSPPFYIFILRQELQKLLRLTKQVSNIGSSRLRCPAGRGHSCISRPSICFSRVYTAASAMLRIPVLCSRDLQLGYGLPPLPPLPLLPALTPPVPPPFSSSSFLVLALLEMKSTSFTHTK